MTFLKHIHWLYVLAFFALFAMYAILGLVAFWLFWPYQTLKIVGYDPSHPIAILNDQIHPGDSLEYNLDYCKGTDIVPVVHRTFLDGQTIILQDISGGLPSGCHTAFKLGSTIVPETLNPGRYYLFVDVDYRVNPIREIHTTYRTDYFTVTKE